ncbi:unnamed protein product, partial [Allacma fusca]
MDSFLPPFLNDWQHWKPPAVENGPRVALE